jgi:glycosyltransferase involved in cell wall biosynthesis
VNVALFSNAQPPSGAAIWQRSTSLVASLAQAESTGASAPVPLPAFVSEPEAWSTNGGALLLHPSASFDAVFRAMRDLGTDLLVIDYDGTAGKQRERIGFLRMAGTLAAASAGSERFQVASILSTEGGAEDLDLFSPLGLTSRQPLVRLVEQSARLFAFSPTAAERLQGRFRRGFEVIASGALVPRVDLTRQEARGKLGFGADRRDLVVGVLGRQGDQRLDLLLAGLKEALRISPGCRVLYLGPDGERLRKQGLPGSFLDGRVPDLKGIALRLRAMDFILRPTKEGDLFDDQCVLAALRNGVPLVATTSKAPDEEVPQGVSVVRASELGAFLEAIEQTCERAMGAELEKEAMRRDLEQFYDRHFDLEAVLKTLALEHRPERTDGKDAV